MRPVGFVTRGRRPGFADQLALRHDRITEEALRIDSFGGVVGAGVDTTRRRKLGAEVARVRLVGSRLFLFHLDRGRRPFLGDFTSVRTSLITSSGCMLMLP